jgi:hypothetical protein
VRHDFQTQLVHRRKRSYLKPCAHPWAALVLFDSVLVRVPLLQCSVFQSHHLFGNAVVPTAYEFRQLVLCCEL